MKKQFILFLIFSLSILHYAALAQNGIGIGTPSPDQSAVLDIQAPSNNKGLLIPRLTTAQRNLIGTPAQGLLVFDTSLNQFCFYNGGSWYTLNEAVQQAGATSVSYPGNVGVSGAVTATSLTTTGSVTANGISASSLGVSGAITATSVTTTGSVTANSITASNYGLNATGNGPIPQGGIIMWSGSVASLPVGWALCDGAGGRPDLRGKFIVGYNSGDPDYNAIGNPGGETRHTLTASELPNHPHALNFYSVKAAVNPAGDFVVGLGPGTSGTGTFLSRTDLIGATGATGISHENRPPYYTLAYIIKL